VPVAPIVPAIANLQVLAFSSQYFNELASILVIVSPIIVTVTVSVAYVALTIIACLSVLVSVRFKTVHLQSNKSYRFAFDVSVTVNVVSPVLVGVHGTAVQNQPPPPHQAGVVYVQSALRYAVEDQPVVSVTQFTDLLVSASIQAKVAKSAPVRAVLNSVIVQVIHTIVV